MIQPRVLSAVAPTPLTQRVALAVVDLLDSGRPAREIIPTVVSQYLDDPDVGVEKVMDAALKLVGRGILAWEARDDKPLALLGTAKAQAYLRRARVAEANSGGELSTVESDRAALLRAIARGRRSVEELAIILGPTMDMSVVHGKLGAMAAAGLVRRVVCYELKRQETPK